MRTNKRLSAGDAAEDGHPCEVAIAFRDVVIRSDIADEIPADVLDLAIQFAWIGKAVSRTEGLNEWCLSGIDPNTREMVAAMAMDSLARETAIEHAVKGRAAVGLDDSLRSIRSSQAFGHALKVAQSVCGRNPSMRDVERLAVLADLSSRLSDTRRLARARAKDGVVSLEAFRKRRKIAG
ncbi:hypothetical protein HFO56_01380 [Rhizobium laguerreae]|uniref:hypothetical protein n=1 Tax=Rhizobium laguerreae TaxID=1076926 RepID=UPI001C8FF27F|nr:hypothetical protein [Rhizobium laguerreae]MBY3151061.1 hypothetical protein [Rhizobium laguerreae]